MIPCTLAPTTEWTRHYSNIYSQFGEDGIIAEIFRRIGTTNKQCFECGAADGKWFSNSRALIDGGWSAMLVEGESSNWPELDKLDNPPRVNVVHGKATPNGPDSLDSLLDQCGFSSDMDLGVIDVDGQDYYLWNGMIRHKPRVMVVEYDRFVDQNFVPDLNGTGQSGLHALLSIAVSKGYFSAATTQTNAIFIRNDCWEKFHASVAEIKPVEAKYEPHQWGDGINATRKPLETKQDSLEVVNRSPSPPVLATGKEQEIKIAAVLSRPRFGLNVFWDCATEALAPYQIPLQSFYGVFWGQCMERAFEENLARGMDWIIALDYDTLFTSRHVQLLIDALAQNPQIDAIAALQPRRGQPTPLAVRSDGALAITGGPVPVRTAHFGLTILRCDAFKKLKKKPWFLDEPAPDGSWGEGRLDSDIRFWGLWGDSGNTLYVHTGCTIGHCEEMASEFTADGKHRHVYLSDWRKANGHQIRSVE